MREWLQLALLVINIVGVFGLIGLSIFLTWKDR